VLYESAQVEPLTDELGSGARRGHDRHDDADAHAAFHPDALWPADESDAWQTPLPLKNRTSPARAANGQQTSEIGIAQPCGIDSHEAPKPHE
jgi:hypothetical protein